MILLLVSLLFSQTPTPLNIPTEDGAQIYVEHFQNAGPSIILAHGISSNHRFWNLNTTHSLALFLHEKGFDVYNMDFRGHGFATHTSKGEKQIQGWTIDSYGIDIHAIIQHIRHQRPQERPMYLGHSLGGLALISYLAQYGSQSIKAMIVVASPFDFRHQEPVLRLARAGASVSILPVPTPMLARIAAFFSNTPAHIDSLLWGKDTISPKIRKELYNSIVSPMTPKELLHLSKTLSQDAFSPAVGSHTYTKNLSEHDIPALFLAGRADRIAPVDRVLGYYNALGSSDKEFRILGKDYGFSIDYGHLDYALARIAPKEVFPIISAWLSKKSNHRQRRE